MSSCLAGRTEMAGLGCKEVKFSNEVTERLQRKSSMLMTEQMPSSLTLSDQSILV